MSFTENELKVCFSILEKDTNFLRIHQLQDPKRTIKYVENFLKEMKERVVSSKSATKTSANIDRDMKRKLMSDFVSRLEAIQVS